MSQDMDVAIEGIGIWAPGIANHASLLAKLRGAPDEPGDAAATAPAKPPASLLAAAERRRAPESVLLACEVAAQACSASGYNAESLPCVFTSMQGDVAISDYMCATLAKNPLELSPTRFHNSVHNAAAGYWTIAAGCHAASTAISADRESFGAGLFEAAVEAVAEHSPVLLVAYDIAAQGPYRDVVPNHISFAVALVLNVASDADRGAPRLRIRHVPDSTKLAQPPAPLADLAAANVTAAPAIALLDALTRSAPQTLALPTSGATHIRIELLA